GGQAQLWDTTTGEQLRAWSVREGLRGDPDFSMLGRWVLVSDSKGTSAHLWDVPTGQKRSVLAGHTGRIITAAASPQGNRVLTSEQSPKNTLRLWDAATGQQLAVLSGHSNEAQPILFSPDGSRIASASFDQTVRLWDGLTGAPIATLQGHAGRVHIIA